MALSFQDRRENKRKSLQTRKRKRRDIEQSRTIQSKRESDNIRAVIKV